MRALNQKLVRDLYRMRGMVAAIAIVIASGVSVLIMSLGALHSLEATAAASLMAVRCGTITTRGRAAGAASRSSATRWLSRSICWRSCSGNERA